MFAMCVPVETVLFEAQSFDGRPASIERVHLRGKWRIGCSVWFSTIADVQVSDTGRLAGEKAHPTRRDAARAWTVSAQGGLGRARPQPFERVGLEPDLTHLIFRTSRTDPVFSSPVAHSDGSGGALAGLERYEPSRRRERVGTQNAFDWGTASFRRTRCGLRPTRSAAHFRMTGPCTTKGLGGLGAARIREDSSLG